jgi:hypothetical protein
MNTNRVDRFATVKYPVCHECLCDVYGHRASYFRRRKVLSSFNLEPSDLLAKFQMRARFQPSNPDAAKAPEEPFQAIDGTIGGVFSDYNHSN